MLAEHVGVTHRRAVMLVWHIDRAYVLQSSIVWQRQRSAC